MDKYVKAVAERGFEAKAVETVKNGRKCKGISVLRKNESTVEGLPKGYSLALIYYPEKGESANDFASRIANEYDCNLKATFDASGLMRMQDPEYIKENVFIAVGRSMDGSEGLNWPKPLYRAFLNLGAVLRVPVTPGEYTRSFMVNESIIKDTGLDPDELWKIADRNAAFGIGSKNNFLVIQSVTTYAGIALMHPEFFESVLTKIGMSECVIMPLNTDEMIFMPVTRETAKKMDLLKIVKEVYEGTDLNYRLEPVLYTYKKGSDNFEIIKE